MSTVSLQLNNLGAGTSITINNQNQSGSNGTITYYYKGGVGNAAAAAAIASLVIAPYYPGTLIPFYSRTVQKLDGGDAIVTDQYRYRQGQASPTSWSNLLYNMVPASQSILWWTDANTTIPSNADIISSGFNANGYANIPMENAAAAGLSQWNRSPEVYRILIPTETTAPVLTNADYERMVGKMNDASFSIGATSFGKGTLLCEPASQAFYQTPTGYSYSIVYSFLARRDGHYDQILNSLGATTPWTATYKYRPRYGVTNFNPLPYYT